MKKRDKMLLWLLCFVLSAGILPGTLGTAAADTRPVLTIQARDVILIYNGQLQGESDTVYEDPSEIAAVAIVDGLRDGDKIESLQIFYQGEDAGVSEVTVSNARVIRGNTVVTDEYDIQYLPGELVIDRRKVTFTGESASRAFTNSEIELTGLTATNLIDGHTHNVTFSVKGTDSGVYTGTFTPQKNIVIMSGDTDVTINYNVILVPGKLTIEPLPGTFPISLEDDEYVYDGSPKANTHTAVSEAEYGKTSFSYSFEKSGNYVSDLGSLVKTDAGEYTIYVKGSNPDYSEDAMATAKLVIQKAGQDAPAAPAADNVTGNSVALKETDGYQYSMDGTGWQDSPVFDGLSPDTEYTFFQRIAGDANHEPSPSSAGTKIRTGDIAYTAVKVEGSEQTVGKPADLVAEIKRNENDEQTFGNYAGAEMDGKSIPENHLSAAKGSLILTVDAAYMKTLAEGSHTLKVSFTDGSVEIPVTIRAAAPTPTPTPRPTPTPTPKPRPVPRTGDSGLPFLWLCLILAGVTGLAVTAVLKGSRKRR